MKKSQPPKPARVDFDLRQLEIFKKVVELKSFSKAADAVSLAQASVSERIATLETLVGTRLLDRMGRSILPTRAGELLYGHAVLLLNMKKTAALELEEFLGAKRGEIHIGASTIPGEYILPKLLGPFRNQYPQVSVAQTIADTNAIRERVLDGEFDLGLIGFKNTHQNLSYHEVWKDELVIAVPPDHPWAEKRTIPLESLREQPLILREPGSGTLRITLGYLKKSGLKDLDRLRPIARLGSSTAVKEGVKSGLGISIISLKAVETELACGYLKAVRIKGIRMFRHFYMIRDRRRVASPLCQAMMTFLQDSLERPSDG